MPNDDEAMDRAFEAWLQTAGGPAGEAAAELAYEAGWRAREQRDDAMPRYIELVSASWGAAEEEVNRARTSLAALAASKIDADLRARGEKLASALRKIAALASNNATLRWRDTRVQVEDIIEDALREWERAATAAEPPQFPDYGNGTDPSPFHRPAAVVTEGEEPQ